MRKSAVIASFVLLSAFCFGGCSLIPGGREPSEADAMAFVQSELDSLDPEDAAYDDMMSSLLEGIQKTAPGVELDNELTNDYLDACIGAFDVLHFTVSGAEKNESGFVVFVDTKPFRMLMPAEQAENWLPYRRELVDAETGDEAIAIHFRAVIDFLKQSCENPEYDEPVTKKVRILRDSDGYYTCSEEDLNDLIHAAFSYDMDAVQQAASEADEILYKEYMTDARNTVEPIEAIEVLFGEFSENTWSNTWFGIGLELDKEWQFAPEDLEELQDECLQDYDGGTRLEKAAEALANGDGLNVVLAYSPGLMIEMSVMRQNIFLMNEEAVLETIKAAREADADSGIPEMSEGTVAGIPRRCVDVEVYYDGYSLFLRYYVIEKDGYYLIITIHGYDREDTAAFDPFCMIDAEDGAVWAEEPVESLSESSEEIVISFERQTAAIRIHEGEEVSLLDDSAYLSWDDGNDYWNLDYLILYCAEDMPPDTWLIEDTSWYEDSADYSEIYQSETKQISVNGMIVEYVVTEYTFMGDMYHHSVEMWTDLGDSLILFAQCAVDCFEQNDSFPSSEELVNQAMERVTIQG